MMFSCRYLFLSSSYRVQLFISLMFQDLESVYPEGCASYVESSFCHALSILESDGVVSGPLVVICRPQANMTAAQKMSHLDFSGKRARATFTALVRITSICKCNSLGPVPLKIEFDKSLSTIVTGLPGKRNQSTTIRIQCFHCAAMRALVVSHARVRAIPREPRATVYIGALAVRAVGCSADLTRFNFQFNGPDYILPITVEIARPPDDLTTSCTPDLCTLLVWNRLRNVCLGPTTSKFWRSVSNPVMVARHGAIGPWTVQLTHNLSNVRVRVRVHREGSVLLLTWVGGQQHIRIPAHKDEAPASATCIEELAGWHVAAIQNDQEGGTLHVKVEEDLSRRSGGEVGPARTGTPEGERLQGNQA
jgi:hypothetical protein